MAQKKQKTGQDLRTLRGLLINPTEQLRLSFWIGGGSMVLVMVVLGILMVALNFKVSSLETTYGLDPELSFALKKSVTSMVLVAVAVVALMTAFCIAALVKMTHRIFGPVVPFLRHIESLKAGDYQSRVRLRKGDAHGELMKALNELAEQLEKAKTQG